MICRAHTCILKRLIVQNNKSARIKSTLVYNFSQQNKIKIDPKQNYYQILKIKRNASLPQIKKSYYVLSMKYHPDVQAGQDKLYNQIRTAYDILSNQKLRKQYDQMTKSQNNNKAQSQNQAEKKFQYNNHGGQSYYYFNQVDWMKVRHGVNMQSFVTKHSGRFKDKGVEIDNQVYHFEIKNKINKAKQLKKQQQQQQNRQIHDKQKLQFQKRQKFLADQHMQRYQTLKKQIQQKEKQKFQKTILGRILKKLKRILKEQNNHKS